MKDYYNILGIDASASEDQIRTAYKKLAMQHHPDRGGDAAQFQEIQEAYSTLTDPSRRAQWEQQKQFEQGGGPGGFSFSFNFGPDVNDIFSQFRNGHPFGHPFKQSAKNRDLRTVIELDLASTLENQTKHVEIRNSDGSVRTVQVNIPRGVQSNMQMRFPGHGENHIKNIPPGDLYVDFKVRLDPRFSIQNLNLVTKHRINCIEAITGCTISVRGVDGRNFDLTVPGGTQPMTTFRIAQQGLWDVNHPVRGDLMVEIHLEVPRSISREQLNQLQQLVN